MVAGVEAAGMTDDTIVTFIGGESASTRSGFETFPFV